LLALLSATNLWAYTDVRVVNDSGNPIPVTGAVGVGGTFVQSTITVTTTGAQVLPALNGRKYLIVINKGTDTIYFKLDSAPGAGQGVPILPGGNYEPFAVPSNAIFLKANSGTQSVEIIQG
jgi:hypothetical protein